MRVNTQNRLRSLTFLYTIVLLLREKRKNYEKR